MRGIVVLIGMIGYVFLIVCVARGVEKDDWSLRYVRGNDLSHCGLQKLCTQKMSNIFGN